ncbi:PD-(D/E)XK nuclease family transposase [Wolbachia endosymbiont (group A) of Rhinocyllus conicus]|uniref:PD-(D/E)XK nuclease family transposase n=1 Tax=Wolbachia endosymbiont (group A) of Rhinocyllus conicus TaxID=2954053 RepID=UPI003872D05C
MALSKFLDPRNDLCFKKIFGTEKNKNILIHFLNDILGFTEINAIQEVEFLSTIMDPEGLCCIASYDGLKIKKMENISSLLFWYL